MSIVESQANVVDGELRKTLTIGRGLGVALGTIIGGGLLVLPGLGYAEVGTSAIYAWSIVPIVVVPLLVVFAKLGAQYPTAGGIQGFAAAAFGHRGSAVAATVVLGACAFGGAAMAISGGNYLASLFEARELVFPFALALLALVTVLQAAGSRTAGSIQALSAVLLIVLLCVVAASPWIKHMTGGELRSDWVAPPSEWMHSLPAVSIIFFAFTGWEMVASTIEEYKNPKRDFPIVVAVSFVVVTVLYIAIAIAVQVTLPPDDPRLTSAPIVGVLSTIVGDSAARIAAATGAAVIFTAFMGGLWATSRVVYATSRARLLPAGLARVSRKTGTPTRAVVCSAIVFALVIVVNAVGWISLGAIFEFASASFLFCYAIAVACFAKVYSTWTSRLVTVLAAIPVLGLGATFGWFFLYPIVIALLAYAVASVRATRGGPLVTDVVAV